MWWIWPFVLTHASFYDATEETRRTKLKSEQDERYSVSLPCEHLQTLHAGDYIQCSLKDTCWITLQDSSTTKRERKYGSSLPSLFWDYFSAPISSIYVALRVEAKPAVPISYSSSELQFETNLKSLYISDQLRSQWSDLLALSKYIFPEQLQEISTCSTSGEISSCVASIPILSLWIIDSNASLRIRKESGCVTDGPVSLSIYVYRSYDTTTLCSCVLLLLVLAATRLIIKVRLVQWLLCATLGSFLLLALVLYWASADLCRTSIGKIGVASVLSFGAWNLIGGILTQNIMQTVYVYIMGRPWVYPVLVAWGVFITALLQYLHLDRPLLICANSGIYLFEALLLLGLVHKNIWACSSVILFLASIYSFRSTKHRFSRNRSSFNNPLEKFPSHAYQTTDYTPEVSNALREDSSQPWHKYLEEGSHHTRQNLSALARYIRRNPSIVHKTYNPEYIARWAGCQDS